MLELDYIYCGDCLEIMEDISDGSIDMILCDLPYGTTACKWDVVIPFDALWAHYKRVIKPNGAIVLTASQPFTSKLVMSNLKMFKYEWIWHKTMGTNTLQAKIQPLRKHENIVVFYGKAGGTYNPQMKEGKAYTDVRKKRLRKATGIVSCDMERSPMYNKGERYPDTVILFSNGNNKSIHPTQKPVALFEYLIRTYTNEGDLVLDNCIGSGTTAIAAIRTGRRFIGIEKDIDYCIVAQERVNQELENKNLLDNDYQ